MTTARLERLRRVRGASPQTLEPETLQPPKIPSTLARYAKRPGERIKQSALFNVREQAEAIAYNSQVDDYLKRIEEGKLRQRVQTLGAETGLDTIRPTATPARSAATDELRKLGVTEPPQTPGPVIDREKLFADIPEVARPAKGSRAEKTMLDRIYAKTPEGMTERAKTLRDKAAQLDMQLARDEKDAIEEATKRRAKAEKEAKRELPLEDFLTPLTLTFGSRRNEIIQLTHDADLLDKGKEPQNFLEDVQRKFTEPGAAFVVEQTSRFIPGYAHDVDRIASKLREQGYSDGRARTLAYNAVDLPWGVKGAIENFAVDPTNVVPGIGFGGIVLKPALRFATGMARLSEIIGKEALSSASKSLAERIAASAAKAADEIEILALRQQRGLAMTQRAGALLDNPLLVLDGKRFSLSGVAGASPEAYDMRTLKGIDEAIRGVDRAIDIERRLGHDVSHLDETKAGLRGLRENNIAGALGEEDFLAYTKAKNELEQFKDQSVGLREGGGSKASLFGTEAGEAAAEEGRIRSIQGNRRMTRQETLGTTKRVIERLEDDVRRYEELAERTFLVEAGLDTPAIQTGAIQAGMGLGEAPPQGSLFENLSKAPDISPSIIDAGRLQARQAAKDAIAKGQIILPGTPEAKAVRRIEPIADKPMFHGTGGDFAQFDVEKADTLGLYGPGLYFTDDAAIASEYATAQRLGPNPNPKAPNVRKVLVSARKPFEVNAPADQSLKDEIFQKAKAQGKAQDADYAFIRTNDDIYGLAARTLGDRRRANEWLANHGFDAIAHTGGKVTGGRLHNVIVLIGSDANSRIKLAIQTAASQADEGLVLAIAIQQDAIRTVGALAGQKRALVGFESANLTPGASTDVPRAGSRALLGYEPSKLTPAEQVAERMAGLKTISGQHRFPAPKVNGAATGEVIPPTHIPSVAAARRQLDSVMYEAIPDSHIDAAASRFYKTGDFKQFVEDLRAIPDGALQKNLEGLPPPPQKPLPVAAEFTEGMENIRPITWREQRWADTASWMEKADNGFMNGIVQKYIKYPQNKMYMASYKWLETETGAINDIFDTYKLNGVGGGKKLRRVTTDVAELMKTADVKAEPSVLLKREDIAERLGTFTDDEQLRIVQAAQEGRLLYDQMIRDINEVRAARGQNLVPYRENYVQHIREQNSWNRFAFNKIKAEELEDIPDFVQPSKAFNPRELRREASMPDREKDFYKLMVNYAESARRDIFHTEIIRNVRAHTRAMRQVDSLKETADVIDNWASEAFAGKMPDWDKATLRVLPGPVVEAAHGIRRNLARAVFPFNYQWSLFIQSSSAIMIAQRFGIRDTLRGLDYLLNPAARKWVKEETYSQFVKMRTAGKFTRQDTAGVGERVLKMRYNPIEKALDIGNFLANAIEDSLTGIANRAAYHHGQRLGLSGRALTEYASAGGAKTQSMYNIVDKPGLLRSQSAQTLFPFQTFSFQMLSLVREMGVLGRAGATGSYETIAANTATGKALMRNRVKMALTLAAGIWAANEVSESMTGRKPYQASSFIPMYGLLSGAFQSTPQGGAETLPGQYAGEFWRGVGQGVQYNDWRGLRRWATRYHLYAGTQANRILDGLEATAKLEWEVGGQDIFRDSTEDARGKELFSVDSTDPVEWFKALSMGPYATEEGREYIEGLRAKDGRFAEWIGPIAPLIDKRVSVGEYLDPLPPFGSSVMGDDGQTEIMTPALYAEKLRDVREKIGERRFMREVPELGKQYVKDETTWKAYKEATKGMSDKDRDAYLRAHPEVDAALFFWGRTETLNSQAGVDKTAEMMKVYGVSEEALAKFSRERVLRPYDDVPLTLKLPKAAQRVWNEYQQANPAKKRQLREDNPIITRIEGMVSDRREAMRKANPVLDAMLVRERNLVPMTRAGLKAQKGGEAE